MSEPVDPALVVVRFLTYGLAVLLFGWATFDAAIAAPQKSRRLPRALVALGLSLSALVYLLLLTGEASGESGWPSASLVATLAMSTDFGRAILVTAFAGLELALWARPPPRLRLVMAGLALAALAFVGHAADGEGLIGALRLALMAAHLLAVGAWVGALAPLASAMAKTDPRSAARVLRRFGILGAWAVAIVLATGVASLALVALGAGRPLGRLYLTTLSVKLALVAGLLGLAAYNRFRLTPAVARGREPALSALRRTIVAEQALGAGAVAAVALLGQLDPSM